MHPLDGPRLKVRRAESQVKALDDSQFALWKDSPYGIIKAEINLKTGKQVYRVRVDDPPSFDKWGVIIGEIAHNLRSALDGLVYQLAHLKTKALPGNTEFPIFLIGNTRRRRNGGLAPHFNRNGKTRIRNLRPEHQEVIESLQPYKRGSGGKNCPLWLVHEINNADKHRLIQVVVAAWGGGPSVDETSEDFKYPFKGLHGRILKNGATFGESPPGMDVDEEIYPLVTFSEGCDAVRRLPVIYTLNKIAKHVSEIVERFSSEFD